MHGPPPGTTAGEGTLQGTLGRAHDTLMRKRFVFQHLPDPGGAKLSHNHVSHVKNFPVPCSSQPRCALTPEKPKS